MRTLKMLQGKRTRGKVRAGLQRRLMDTGKGTGYQAVTIRVTIGQGVDAWRTFAKDASEDMLARVIVAAGGSYSLNSLYNHVAPEITNVGNGPIAFAVCLC